MLATSMVALLFKNIALLCFKNDLEKKLPKNSFFVKNGQKCPILHE
jgi:hypothetical protein